MGKPFTKVSHDTLEALNRACLTGAAYQMIGHIIRRTHGFQKEGDRISVGQFQKATGLSRQSIIAAVKLAQKRNIIWLQKSKGQRNTYGLNPPGEWQKLVKQTVLVTSQVNDTSGSQVNRTSKAPGVVKQNGLDQYDLLDQTSQVATKGTTMRKDTLKDTIKENTPHHPTSSKKRNHTTTTPQDTTTGKSSIDKNFRTTPAGRNRQRVLDFLIENGPCRTADVVNGLGFERIKVGEYLGFLKTKGLTNNLSRGLWTASYTEKLQPEVTPKGYTSTPVKKRAEPAPRTLDYTHGAEPAVGELATEAAADINEVSDVLWFLEEPAELADIADAQCFGDSELAGRILKVLEKHGWVTKDGDCWQCVKGAA